MWIIMQIASKHWQACKQYIMRRERQLLQNLRLNGELQSVLFLLSGRRGHINLLALRVDSCYLACPAENSKLLTRDSSPVSISLSQHHFTNTPHLRPYRHLVESARDSVSMSSRWEGRVLRSSRTPKATPHEGSTSPGWGAISCHLL